MCCQMCISVPSKTSAPLLPEGDSKMHTYGTIANSQGMADETNENDAISTVRILVQKVIMSDI